MEPGAQTSADNLNMNLKIFNQVNKFHNVFCKMAAIL